jgi:sugar transferase (PEP-CTERM/EpsH1 system associated)
MHKILYITHRVPYPLDKGDRIRCWHILRMLSRYAQVDLLALADEAVHPEASAALRHYVRNCYFVNTGGLRRYARMLARLFIGQALTVGAFCSREARRLAHRLLSSEDYRFVLISNSALLYLLPETLGNIALIVDMMDVDSRKWRIYSDMRHGLSYLYRRESKLIAQVEKRILHRASAVLLTTQAEASYLLSSFHSQKVIVVGNGVDPGYYGYGELTADKLSPSIVYFGALDYWPNIDAVNWFAHSVWPKLHKVMPTMQFHVIGRRPVRKIRILERVPGIVVHGDVPDIRPLVCQASIAVFPLRVVMGIPNKVLEGLALGRACIVSPQVHDIISGDDAVHYLIANDANDWLDKIVWLANNPAALVAIGRNARMLARTKFSWDVQLSPLVNVIRRSMSQITSTIAHVEQAHPCLN